MNRKVDFFFLGSIKILLCANAKYHHAVSPKIQNLLNRKTVAYKQRNDRLDKGQTYPSFLAEVNRSPASAFSPSVPFSEGAAQLQESLWEQVNQVMLVDWLVLIPAHKSSASQLQVLENRGSLQMRGCENWTVAAECDTGAASQAFRRNAAAALSTRRSQSGFTILTQIMMDREDVDNKQLK